MKRFILMLLFAGAASVASATEMTNADVVRLAKAGMDEETIVMSIQTAEPKFDLSTDALLTLRQESISPIIIRAMLKATQDAAKGHASSTVSSSSTSSTAAKYDPEKIIWENGKDRVYLKYIIPSNRTAARAFGWGGFATYMVLGGPAAVQRVTDRQPKFVVAVPENAQPTSYMTMASFAVRNNGTREVMIGGGYASYSSGIHPDRIIATTAEKLESQDACPSGFILYRVEPTRPLAPGEYGLVLSNNQYRMAGIFANVSNSCFDFGIDFPVN
jgi:hypothetical protein